MSEIRWEDPPTPHNNSYHGRWGRIAEALRLRPGEWAMVEVKPSITAARSTAGNVVSGRLRGIAPNEFEAVGRTVDGEHRVYARYVGGAS